MNNNLVTKNQLLFGLSLLGCSMMLNANEPKPSPKLTEVWQPVPQKVSAKPIPSDAIILLNKGVDVNAQWQHTNGDSVKWHLQEGILTVTPKSGSIISKQKFCDMQMHLEWRAPRKEERAANAPGHANSGIKIQRRYEVQILETYGRPIYVNGQAASIYKQSVPLVDAISPAGDWNSYDIIFKAPRFDEQGELVKAANISVLHNGILVQDQYEIKGKTMYVGEPKYFDAHGCEPILLQDHGGKISFRNIWVRPL
ncbi:3-keto-disaccharide hydrolase [Gayadomonas joobiniege]|uniref:3-keto-disaccharide hydrolase n=1 Tax=Gayadomonas joobiniege TaxID=1234606 RepID=UPI00037F1515|nr:DUF1080 domain-containing protein [Gayadomonas joobiniege]